MFITVSVFVGALGGRNRSGRSTFSVAVRTSAAGDDMADYEAGVHGTVGSEEHRCEAGSAMGDDEHRHDRDLQRETCSQVPGAPVNGHRCWVEG